MKEGTVSVDEVRKGVSRLGHREGADMLLAFLRNELERTVGGNIESGAVMHFEGRRSLAHELIELLEAELPSDRSGSTRSTIERPGPVRNGRGGAERRVPVDPPEGWGKGPRREGSADKA